MSRYKFIKGFPIEGLRENFETSLFHHTRQLLLQSETGWCSYAIIDSSETIIEAIIHFHIHGGIASSPLRAPFGSLVFSKELSVEILKDFLNFIDEDFREKDINTVFIKNYPDIYFPYPSEVLKSLLSQHGYLVDHTDQSAVIAITDKPFKEILHKSARKRLKKCYNANLAVNKLPLSKLVDVHSFLKKCREDKGYTLSMSRFEIETTIEVFPDNFYLFAVFSNDEMIAANISILVNKRVLYNFYHDHIKSADTLSPVILLNECMYEFCQRERIEILDLGTSSVDKVINQSLLDFKLRLGAVTTPKVTFVKTLGYD